MPKQSSALRSCSDYLPLFFACLLSPLTVSAQPVKEFYGGRTVTLAIGTEVGGTIDLYGRTVARHLARHLPGIPTFIIQNVPGASSLKLANMLPISVPKDGSYIAAINRLPIYDKIYAENSFATFGGLVWLA